MLSITAMSNTSTSALGWETGDEVGFGVDLLYDQNNGKSRQFNILFTDMLSGNVQMQFGF